MNILGFILGKKDSLEAIPASSFDFSNLLPFLEQEGAFVIYGTGREIKSFYRRANAVEGTKQLLIKKFAILTGEVDKLITAIPLDSREVLDSALAHLCLAKRPSFEKRLMIGVFRILNQPLLYRFVFRRQFCLVVNKETETLFSFLLQGLNIRDIKLSFSIYKSSGKFVVPLFNSETGENIGYAKIYASKKDSEHYGKTEARALRFLKQFPFKSAEVPSVLLSNYFGDNLVTVISSKNGLRNFKSVSNEHIEWIKELAKETGVKELFKDSSFAIVIKGEMELIKNKIGKDDFWIVNQLYEEAVKSLSDKEFIFSFTNRDFDYHELLHHKDGNLVIDWEYAHAKFPPLFDVYSLLLSEGARGNGDYVEMHVRNLEATFFRENRKTSEIVVNFLRKWGIKKDDAYFVFLFFLVDRLYLSLYVGSYRNSEPANSEIAVQFLKKIHNEPKYQENWLLYKK
ncbi:MAG TPA: hypothetical protein ENH86_00455 [Candidatus Jorgensenbacteria bacterium]|nr:hypothetical protein [Candidatus Jorgensenbacteria bacterium]